MPMPLAPRSFNAYTVTCTSYLSSSTPPCEVACHLHVGASKKPNWTIPSAVASKSRSGSPVSVTHSRSDDVIHGLISSVTIRCAQRVNLLHQRRPNWPRAIASLAFPEPSSSHPPTASRVDFEPFRCPYIDCHGPCKVPDIAVQSGGSSAVEHGAAPSPTAELHRSYISFSEVPKMASKAAGNFTRSCVVPSLSSGAKPVIANS